jgi:mannose-6-phosphate isomerase
MLQRLTPSFREKVWGATRLSPWFPDSPEKIGEVWFEAPDRKILVKFLFTSEKLSVQVHPPGKTEMWHILRAEPGARIAAGFREPLSEARLREAALSGEIVDLLQWHDARPGDTFFVPAGVVHAIGEGLALCEIQQHADVTYRLYDYGRPRELHLEGALRVSRREPHQARRTARDGVLVACEHFATEEVRVMESLRHTPERAELWISVEGAGTFGGQPAAAGGVWYLAPPCGELEIAGNQKLLRTVAMSGDAAS